jgi:hypothetical protein
VEQLARVVGLPPFAKKLAAAYFEHSVEELSIADFELVERAAAAVLRLRGKRKLPNPFPP